MKKMKTLFELKREIQLTKQKKVQLIEELKEETNITLDKFKPTNIIKNTLTDLSHSSSLKGHLLATGMGLGAGFITKKLLVGASVNPIKKLLGNLTQLGVSYLVAKKGDSVAPKILNVLSFLFAKK